MLYDGEPAIPIVVRPEIRVSEPRGAAMSDIVLTFDAAAVRRIVEHALAAEHHSGFDEATGAPCCVAGKPALLLVHDDGTYLMSNGLPEDQADGPDRPPFVVYAEGWTPTGRHPGCIVSYLIKTLPWAAEVKAMLDDGATAIRFAVRDNDFELISRGSG